MEINKYNPIISFTYLMAMICFSCMFMHPIYLGISITSAFLCFTMLKNTRAALKGLLIAVPIILGMAVLNPLFNHEGATILGYLPWGAAVTLQAVLYGVAAAVMLASVIMWFSCFSIVMTSDKLIYLFGRIVPVLSLVLSMTLRFVPRFIRQLRELANAQKCLGKGIDKGSLCRRMKNSASILSTMLTWSLENAIVTADSMKSRGYGTKRRTAFSVYSFTKKDRTAGLFVGAAAIYIIVGVVLGGTRFVYFPKLTYNAVTWYGISIYIAYTALAFMPVLAEAWEVVKWKSIQSRI